MGIGHDENISKEELIKKLRAIIHAESNKPASEMDADLVTECVDYLMELENSKRLTESEIDSEIQKIIVKSQRPRKTSPRFKALLIAACMAVIILSFNVFAFACGTDAISLLRNLGNKVVEMFDGEKIQQENIEIVKGNADAFYKSTEEFLEKEKLPVLYPTALPNDAKITNIALTASFVNGTYNPAYKDVLYATDKPSLSISIRTNPEYIKGFLSDPNAEIKTINEHECYIIQLEAGVQCFFVHDNNVYIVNAHTREDTEFIINNLKENKPQ